ncbi:MAG: HIT domain-containing protein [Anaerolineales bacterium]|nr:HIT domain-containing protein [Anaerolineales bacterium]
MAKNFDEDAYIHRIQTGPCFICEMIAGRLEGNHIIYQDEHFIAFLSKWMTLYGHTLVAPIQHKEQVTGDFSPEEYLQLQKAVYRVAEAVRKAFAPERVYILSLGSQQGNRHVHWHIAPLPPGIPFKEQQLAALSVERGVLDLSEEEMEGMVVRIRTYLEKG